MEQYLDELTHEKVITGGLLLQAIFTFCYMICSFVVASTANMGFNAVLTALLYIAYILGTYHVIHNSKMPLAIGFLIGVSVMTTFLSLQTAIFWGQLSHCSTGYSNISHYSCRNRSAYSATCAFATLLFLVQIVFTAVLVLWRDDFLGDSIAAYDDIHGLDKAPGEGGGASQTSYNQSTTADL